MNENKKLSQHFQKDLNEKQAPNKRIQQTIGSPHITILSEDSAVIAYSRIVQYQDWLVCRCPRLLRHHFRLFNHSLKTWHSDGRIRTDVSSETRVWRREQPGTAWTCCHLHRSNVLHNSTWERAAYDHDAFCPHSVHKLCHFWDCHLNLQYKHFRFNFADFFICF